MVRTYKKKTKRGEWSTISMKTAIDKVLSKEMGYRKASSEHGVPQTTLERYVKKMKEGGEVTIGVPLGPKQPIFTAKEEDEMVAYLKHMEERLFGLTTLDLRRLAYQLASSFENASPGDILPIPSVQRTEKRKQYRRGKTAVITSTPYKNELENLKKVKKVSNPNDPRLKKNAKKIKKTTVAAKTKNNDDEDTICLYCKDENHTFLKSSEGWVGCQLCGRWAHNACAGVDDENTEEIHICVYCDNN